MKKKYQTPALEEEFVEIEDVIASSGQSESGWLPWI